MQFSGVTHDTPEREAFSAAPAALTGSGALAGVQVPLAKASIRPCPASSFLAVKYSPTATHEPGLAHEMPWSSTPSWVGTPWGTGARAAVQIPWVRVSISPGVPR